MAGIKESSRWKEDLKKSIHSPEDLPSFFKLTEKEKQFFTAGEKGFRFSVPRYYFGLSENREDDPVRRQFMPSAEEFIISPSETDDPLDENRYKVTARLIHRYPDRALFLASDVCAMYCRHCFRRDYLASDADPVTDRVLHDSADYLKLHTEINELILSGGDPLMLDDRLLERQLEAFRSARKNIVFRLASRIPAVLPSRVTDGLASLLGRYRPVFFITQFNHPAELTAEAEKAVKTLLSAGIPVLNQAVLLKGVNDDPGILAELFQGLVRFGIKPYYLFQGDMAAGTGHLRVSILKGFEIERKLRKRISGLAMPVYAVDLPGGGGKVPLVNSSIEKITKDSVYFKNGDGKIYSYPVES